MLHGAQHYFLIDSAVFCAFHVHPEAQGRKKRASPISKAVYHSHFVHGTQGAACMVNIL